MVPTVGYMVKHGPYMITHGMSQMVPYSLYIITYCHIWSLHGPYIVTHSPYMVSTW